MKVLFLAIVSLVAASSHPERAATKTTKTVSQCPPFPTPAASTYVPPVPTACKTITSKPLTYKFYAKKCYHQVKFEKDDRGNFFEYPRSDVCRAAQACADVASPDGGGKVGNGRDHAFVIYWYPKTEDSAAGWVCYTFVGNPAPALDQYDGGLTAREAFGWAHSGD